MADWPVAAFGAEISLIRIEADEQISAVSDWPLVPPDPELSDCLCTISSKQRQTHAYAAM